MKVQVIKVSYVITAFDSDKLQVGDVLTSNDGWLKISEPPESMKDYFTSYPLPRGNSFEYYTPDGVASIKVGQVWDVNRPKSEGAKYVGSIDVTDEAPLDKVKPYMEKFNRKMDKIKDREPKKVERYTLSHQEQYGLVCYTQPDVDRLLSEQHRNTRHDAVEVFYRWWNDYQLNENTTVTEADVETNIPRDIMNLPQRKPI